MSPALLVILPTAVAVVLACVGDWRIGAVANAAASVATAGLAVLLLLAPPPTTPLFFIDDFNGYFAVLTALVAATTAVFSAGYVGHEVAIQRLSPLALRIYHAMYQLLTAAMLLALVANNLGLIWIAVEAATLITVLMVSLYRTREAIEAAWKYFILGSVGIALALFGTVVVYLAGAAQLGDGLAALAWTNLHAQAGRMAADVLNLGFVFLLVGYGTKVGLAPLHAWLPDAHAEGPTPISAVLSGLLLNVALYALLRFKMLLTANGHALAPGPLMIGLGLGSLLFAGLMLYRRRDIKRFFAYSSIEHMGITVFAFGLGGPLASFAGLVHMAMHSLTKSAIFFSVGRIAQVKGTQKMAELSGLTASHPVLGWGFVLAVLAIAGLPPFGLFLSEFLVVTAAIPVQPLLAVPLGIGLLVALAALVLRLQAIAFGPPTRSDTLVVPASTTVPLYLHLGLVLIAGVAFPHALADYFQTVARLLG